jgi:TPR repeat protein
MTFRYYSLLSRGWDTVHAANNGDARSQYELGIFHHASAMRLDILQGASADDAMVAARWEETMWFMERAAEQGDTAAQVVYFFIAVISTLPVTGAFRRAGPPP